ncbi:MAG: methyltransferase domain-containing protein [Lautropia sp.]
MSFVSLPARTGGSVRRPIVAALVFAASLACAVPVLAQKGPAEAVPDLANETFKPQSGQAGKDVIWVPTPDEIVEALLDLASVKPGDIHYDLGSGDGKIAIAAAKRGANSTGVEYNPDMVGLSQRNALRAGVKNVRFVRGDIFETDFSKADVITLYLLPGLNMRLRPTILEMKPGTRVASHQFTMGDWEPDQKRTINGRDALFWVVPAKVAGRWNVSVPGSAGNLELNLTQTFQKVDGTATWGTAAAKLEGMQLSGDKISFTVADAAGAVHRFTGTAGNDGKMSGTVTDPAGKQQPFTGTR